VDLPEGPQKKRHRLLVETMLSTGGYGVQRESEQLRKLALPWVWWAPWWPDQDGGKGKEEV